MEYFVLLIIISSIFFHSKTSNSFSTDGFLECFTSHLQHHHDQNDTVYSKIILTKSSSHYTSLLQSSIQNGRFLNTSLTPKPEIILTPNQKVQVQAAVICSKRNELQIRVRSGGHDYEGLSYFSDVSPFMIIDLINFQSIKVDIENEVAAVEAGASIGQLYYEIAKKSKVHGFPAGSCPTVGVGGHFSGGGFGTIFRKYGLAADNILDAEIVNVNGEILNRTSMGEDLFWAIRGGGGASFGVILSWKVKLVRVPQVVTISHIEKTQEEGGSQLLYKWQTTGWKLHEDLFLHVVTTAATTPVDGAKKTIQVGFTLLFLGPAKNLVSLMDQNFPELGLQLENCTEMSWIQSVLSFAGFSINGPLEILANRSTTNVGFFKAKSDYVSEPISEIGLEGLWEKLYEGEGSYLIWSPYGGRMSQISESEIPFPHRSGNLYGIQYMVTWHSENETENRIGWMKRLYSYMEPYVSKSPRAAYFNYRDLDIGSNERVGNTSYAKASTWGKKYFKRNFMRLVRVKTKVDPSNYFRDEQSIPVLQSRRMKGKN